MDVFWGLAIPFLGTTLGSAMVFFMKNKVLNKYYFGEEVQMLNHLN